MLKKKRNILSNGRRRKKRGGMIKGQKVGVRGVGGAVRDGRDEKQGKEKTGTQLTGFKREKKKRKKAAVKKHMRHRTGEKKNLSWPRREPRGKLTVNKEKKRGPNKESGQI